MQLNIGMSHHFYRYIILTTNLGVGVDGLQQMSVPDKSLICPLQQRFLIEKETHELSFLLGWYINNANFTRDQFLPEIKKDILERPESGSDRIQTDLFFGKNPAPTLHWRRYLLGFSNFHTTLTKFWQSNILRTNTSCTTWCELYLEELFPCQKYFVWPKRGYQT